MKISQSTLKKIIQEELFLEYRRYPWRNKEEILNEALDIGQGKAGEKVMHNIVISPGGAAARVMGLIAAALKHPQTKKTMEFFTKNIPQFKQYTKTKSMEAGVAFYTMAQSGVQWAQELGAEIASAVAAAPGVEQLQSFVQKGSQGAQRLMQSVLSNPRIARIFLRKNANAHEMGRPSMPINMSKWIWRKFAKGLGLGQYRKAELPRRVDPKYVLWQSALMLAKRRIPEPTGTGRMFMQGHQAKVKKLAVKIYDAYLAFQKGNISNKKLNDILKGKPALKGPALPG